MVYGIVGDEASKYFAVESETGVVWLRQSLDREVIKKKIHIVEMFVVLVELFILNVQDFSVFVLKYTFPKIGSALQLMLITLIIIEYLIVKVFIMQPH